MQEMCLFCYQKPKFKWKFYCIIPYLHYGESDEGESGSGNKEKAIGSWFSSKFAPIFYTAYMVLWSESWGRSVGIFCYIAILLFLSNLFEIIHYTCIESFEFRSQEFRIFALQPHQRTGPVNHSPYVKTPNGHRKKEKKLIFQITPLISECC